MSILQPIAFIGFVVTFPAWASPPSAAAAPARNPSVTVPAVPKIQRRMQHDQIEVRRLEREVARQESDSDRASQRLREQDQQIAELRRKLSQLQPEPAVGHP